MTYFGVFSKYQVRVICNSVESGLVISTTLQSETLLKLGIWKTQHNDEECRKQCCRRCQIKLNNKAFFFFPFSALEKSCFNYVKHFLEVHMEVECLSA